MKKYLYTILSIFIIFSCSNADIITDNEFEKIFQNQREAENFHYMGTKNGFDYVVGEQWAAHSLPSKAKSTERYFRIKQSKYIRERFKYTSDIKQWVTIKDLKP